MKYPVLIRVHYQDRTHSIFECSNHEEFESKMAVARNSTATKIQVFEHSYALGLQSQWAQAPAIQE